MNDAPLFQNADEQEAVYGGTGASNTGDRGATEDESVPAGIAGAGILPGAGGAGGVASTSGILPANALPEVAGDDAHEDPTVMGN